MAHPPRAPRAAPPSNRISQLQRNSVPGRRSSPRKRSTWYFSVFERAREPSRTFAGYSTLFMTGDGIVTEKPSGLSRVLPVRKPEEHAQLTTIAQHARVSGAIPLARTISTVLTEARRETVLLVITGLFHSTGQRFIFKISPKHFWRPPRC